jgi:hypothetical protein
MSIRRRSLCQSFAFVFGALLGFRASAQPDGVRALKESLPDSFDAQEWAKTFVRHVRLNPGIATDESTMTAWFANAIMCGFDECRGIVERERQIARDEAAMDAEFIG